MTDVVEHYVRTIVVFLVGIAVEIPFMNAYCPQSEGPVASALHGADISWLVGFIVAGGLYYLVTPHAPSARPTPKAVATETRRRLCALRSDFT
jgi:nucleobase:cation symporter-1, NCS1 family